MAAGNPFATKEESKQIAKDYFRDIQRNVESINAGEGGKIYSSQSEAEAVNPKPTDGTIFQIENIGYYKFDSSESNGILFLRPYLDEYKVNETIQLVDGVFEGSNNLLDKNTFIKGYYVLTGVLKQSSDNWFATPKISIKSNTAYTLNPTSGVPNTHARVVFFDSSDNFISSIEGLHGDISSVTFTTPSNASKVAFTLGNELGVGLNPTDNEWTDVMLNEGSSALPYEPYGGGIDATKINNLDQVTVSKSTYQSEQQQQDSRLTTNEANINIALQNLDIYGEFNGVDSEINLGQDYIIDSPGDYLEFEARVSSDFVSFRDGLGMFGKGIQVDNVFGVYGSQTYWLRQSSGGSYIELNVSKNPIGNWQKVKLQVSSDGNNWELHVDGSLEDSKPKTDSLVIRNIGQAYEAGEFAKFDLKYANINISGTLTEISDPSGESGAVNVARKYTSKESETTPSNVDFPEFFYEVQPSGGGDNAGMVICYTKRKGFDDIYVGHEIQRYKKDDEIVFADYWRNHGAWNYKYNGSQMTKLSDRVLMPNENEFTFILSGKDDHTGGVHGDEKTVTVEFIADAKVLDLNTAKELTACRTLSYHITSTLHETVDTSAPNTPIPGHPVIANHTKTVTFSNGGYRILNAVKAVTQLDVVRLYAGIVCNEKTQATFGYDGIGERKTFDFSVNGAQVINTNYSTQFYGSNPVKGFESYIDSRVVSHKDAPLEQKMTIVDRVSDSKYYNAISNFQMLVDDIVITECTVEFS